jgi:ABC-type phosphate transport system substrate-binding protein
MEFERANRGAVYAQAVTIDGSIEGQKGRVKFKSPTFKLTPVSEETNRIATALDRELQAFLTAYLRKTKQQQADQAGTEPQPEPEMVTAGITSELTDDDIPF